MTAGGAARKGLAALIVNGGASGEDGAKLLGQADPGGAAAKAADPKPEPVESDPYVELAGEAIDAFQAGDANALAAVLRAVRGLPVE